MSNNQELGYYDDLVDTDTELEHGTVNDTEEVEKAINKNVTTVIAENEQDEKSMIQNLFQCCGLCTNRTGRSYWYFLCIRG